MHPHPQWRVFLVVLGLSVFLSACGKEKTPTANRTGNNPTSSNPSGTQPSPTSSFSIQGKWATGCHTDYWEYGEYGYKVELQIGSSDISEKLTYFYDTSCTEQWDNPENSSATYTLGADVSGQTGTKELNLSTGLPDVRQYQIVRVSGNEMYFGDTSSRDGRSAANRPSTINSTIRYTKQN